MKIDLNGVVKGGPFKGYAYTWKWVLQKIQSKKKATTNENID